jgi:hypothetical protein
VKERDADNSIFAGVAAAIALIAPLMLKMLSRHSGSHCLLVLSVYVSLKLTIACNFTAKGKGIEFSLGHFFFICMY